MRYRVFAQVLATTTTVYYYDDALYSPLAWHYNLLWYLGLSMPPAVIEWAAHSASVGGPGFGFTEGGERRRDTHHRQTFSRFFVDSCRRCYWSDHARWFRNKHGNPSYTKWCPREFRSLSSFRFFLRLVDPMARPRGPSDTSEQAHAKVWSPYRLLYARVIMVCTCYNGILVLQLVKSLRCFGADVGPSGDSLRANNRTYKDEVSPETQRVGDDILRTWLPQVLLEKFGVPETA